MLRATPMLMGGGAGGITLPQTVFATSLYTGTGASQTINNGLDLLGSGGLTWFKSRSDAYDHYLFDSARGSTAWLQTDTTNAEASSLPASYYSTFLANGFTVGSGAALNQSGQTRAAWSFRQAPKFFQCIQFVGDGTSGRQIPHNLGVAPGMVVVKRRDAAADWYVYHRSLAANTNLFLDLTNAAANIGTTDGIQSASLSTFQVGSSNSVNAAGATYVAYLWAHDPDPSGIISCGSFTTDASGNASVNLGWSPQFVMLKQSSATGNWYNFDTARGWGSGPDAQLLPNLSAAEASSFDVGAPTASGFTIAGSGGYFPANSTVIYMAIRAPIFTGPTRPQDAFATSLYTGNNAAQTVTNGLDLAGKGGLVWQKGRSFDVSHFLNSTATPGNSLQSNDTGAQVAAQIASFTSSGFTLSGAGSIGNISGNTYAAWSFVRKPKFFDVVTYTGDGTSGRQISHALGVAPGMIIVKRRETASQWVVYHRSIAGNYLYLNQTAASTAEGGILFGDGSAHVPPTSAVFTIGANNNQSGGTYVAYLWAHDPSPDGIVQAGSFIGGQTVTLGWRPQFLLYKSSSAVSNWVILDLARGWTGAAGADRPLYPNTSDSEPGGTFGAPRSTGFFLDPATGNVTNGANYVYLAIREPTT